MKWLLACFSLSLSRTIFAAEKTQASKCTRFVMANKMGFKSKGAACYGSTDFPSTLKLQLFSSLLLSTKYAHLRMYVQEKYSESLWNEKKEEKSTKNNGEYKKGL